MSLEQILGKRISSNIKSSLKLGLASLATIGALAANPEKANSTTIPFTVEQGGNVTAPVYGLAAEGTNYLLTHSGDTATLPKDFNGNNQETPVFNNPSTAKDAASFDETRMLQLATDNNVRKVNLSDGTQALISGNQDLFVGNNSFGIGYDAAANVMGVGRYDAAENEMTFLTYDFNLQSFTSTNTFTFNQSQYGTPTGLDFAVVNGQKRMVVGTRDGPASGPLPVPRNFVLDMSLGGDIGQHFTTLGGTYKLEDVLVDPNNNSIAIGYRRNDGNQGRVEVGEFHITAPDTFYVMGLGSIQLGDNNEIELNISKQIEYDTERRIDTNSQETVNVQYTDDLRTQEWSYLGPITLTNGVGSITDSNPSSMRFYRIVE